MTRRLLTRLAAALLAVLLACPAMPARAAENDVIRVLLTRFGTVTELPVHLSGSYSCGNVFFQRGMSVTLSVGEAGQVLLKYQGLTMAVDGELVLTRHRTGGENGLRPQGVMNLYNGDLHVTHQNGALRLILHVPLEEYLLGVLPWEMSNAFPLEALKAQAVAARTYALTRRNPKRDYDVVDNTNDQVYAGQTAGSGIISRAVRETNGMCVYYQGQLVTCYYTASNGGWTDTIAHVWGIGSEPAGYTVAKEDPYDLANGESTVKRAELKRKPAEEDWPALQTLLKAALGPRLKRIGYAEDPEHIRIREIVSVTAEEVQNGAAKSLSFTVLADALRVAGDDEEEISFSGEVETPAPTADPGGLTSLSNPLKVSLSIFPALESALDLSINGSANELWHVTETRDAFVIEARRFGHGVGLSQRGAQRMAAQEGWDYKRILHFYYDGVVLRRVNLTAVTPAPAFDGRFDATPGPAPTATPKPTLMPLTLKPEAGERQAIVDGIDQDSSLNLRAEPNSASEILMRLYYGQRLAVLEADNGWLHVRTDAAEGYVMEKFVTVTETEAIHDDQHSSE